MKYYFYLSCLCFVLISNCSFAATGLIQESENVSVERICSPTECYLVLAQLGEGAFGRVYAVENSNGMRFAIKSHKSGMSFHLLADAEREFKRGQLLDHPNIVKVFDFFTSYSPTHEMTTNILLELVEGKTLHHLSKRSLSSDESINAAVQFVHALQYALTLNLMHIDLHGGNIMLDNQENMKVIDLASFYTPKELFNFIVQESEEKSSSLTPASMRSEKLKTFFSQNPRLSEQLLEAYEKTSHQTAVNNVNASHEDTLYPGLYPFRAYYFNRIVGICDDLITKSDLSRQEKVNLRAEIQKLSWNYQEDIEDGKYASLEAYLDLLTQRLQFL